MNRTSPDRSPTTPSPSIDHPLNKPPSLHEQCPTEFSIRVRERMESGDVVFNGKKRKVTVAIVARGANLHTENFTKWLDGEGSISERALDNICEFLTLCD